MKVRAKVKATIEFDVVVEVEEPQLDGRVKAVNLANHLITSWVCPENRPEDRLNILNEFGRSCLATILRTGRRNIAFYNIDVPAGCVERVP